MPCIESRMPARIGVSKRFCWWPKAGQFRKRPRLPGPRRGASMPGLEPMCTRIVRTVFAMRRDPDGPVSPERSRMHESCTSYGVIPCVWVITPPAGRCRCWRNISGIGTAVRSRPARCGDGCETWTCDGNAPGMSTPPRTPTVPRKKGAYSDTVATLQGPY
jgi:hypothetical protein